MNMSWVARDTLRSVYGKPTWFPITVYLALIKESQIQHSVDCRNCWSVMYPMCSDLYEVLPIAIMSQYEHNTLMAEQRLLSVRTWLSMIDTKRWSGSYIWELQSRLWQSLACSGCESPDVWLVVRTWRKDIDTILSTIWFIYGYLLTFSTGRFSLNLFPVQYLLVLYRSQQGYSSLEVQSCMFIIQLHMTVISITS